MTIINANIKSKREALDRMLNGEVFYTDRSCTVTAYAKNVAEYPKGISDPVEFVVDYGNGSVDPIRGLYNSVHLWHTRS